MYERIYAMKTTVLVVAAGVAGLVACTTSSVPDAPVPQTTEMLMDVSVDRDGDVTVVTLVGVEAAAFSVTEHSEPWSLAVDLGGMEVGAALAPVAVYDGVVDQVSVSSFADADGTTSTRVEIALAGEAWHETVAGDTGVTIRISARDAGDTAADEDVWQQAEPLAAAATPLAPPPAATTVSQIGVQTLDGGVIIHLRADGVIGQAESFTLSDPDRLVIDLAGMASTVESDVVGVDSEQVSKIRLGAHADKLRVVMDGGTESNGFAARRVMPVADGLYLTVGESEAVETALTLGMDASDAAWRATQLDAIQLAAAVPVEEVAEDAIADFAVAEEQGWALEHGDEPVDLEAAVDTETFEELAAEPALADEEIAVFIEPEFVESELVEPEFVESEIVESEIVEPEIIEPEMVEQVAEWVDESASSDTATALTTVYGVEYETDVDQQVERIAVVTSGNVRYDWLAPDAETVMVRIPGAVVADGAAGQIATREGGPLSLISVFQQPDVEPAEVRIVIKRQADLVPVVAAAGQNLLVEFAANVPVDDVPAALMADVAVSEVAIADRTDPQMPSMPAEIADYESLPVIDDTAAVAVAVPVADAFAEIAPPPASLEPPAAIDVLEEGGLIDGKEYRGRRLSLDFKDVEIADVLRLIAEVSDLNIISGDEVKGKVSIRLVDVPWDQALDVILLTKGLGFVRVGNVLRIAPGDVLAQEEEVRLQERRAKEKLEDLVVKLIPVNYADVKEMQSLIKRLLTPRGSVNVDQRTSTLIVKDIPSVIDESTALIKAVDTETPQVMIEAKIVEANLDFARELGSVWSTGAQGRVDAFDTGSATRTDLGSNDFRLGPSASLGGVDGANSLSFINNLTAQPTALANLSAFLLDEKINIDVQLQAAENTGNGKVVSSPRVVTLDNTDAEVAQGISIPFQTFENGDAKLEFVDAVLSLKVTPHITSDKSIIMKIQVTRDAPDSTVQTATGSPAISKNEAKTETLVKDGQTLVLGGIYTVEKSFRQSRVPYLHRIPILGAAFKSKEVSDKRKELLIFVTPRIVIQPGADA